MLSGSVGVQTFPLMIGNMICGVLIWIINSRDKWKVCSPFWYFSKLFWLHHRSVRENRLLVLLPSVYHSFLREASV